MSKTSRLAGALLLTSALVAPSIAHAQDTAPPADMPPTGETVAEPAPAEPVEEEVDLS